MIAVGAILLILVLAAAAPCSASPGLTGDSTEEYEMSGISFRPSLAKLVLAGAKTETRRLVNDNPNSPWYRGACGYRKDGNYAVQPGRGKRQIGRLQVVEHPERRKLSEMRDQAARAEGCVSLEAFKALWLTLHGSWDPSTEVWALRFIPYLRYHVVIPPLGLGWNQHFGLDNVDRVRELLTEHRSAWAIDHTVGHEVSREAIGIA